MGLEGYGLEPGCKADMVVLQATDPLEAIRLRPARLHVIRRGAEIAHSAPQTSTLTLANRQVTVDPSRSHRADA